MKTALVIDDDAPFRKQAYRWLLAAGWRALEAADGEKGLAIALRHQPEVIVCDLRVPRYNGFQVCRMIRAQRNEIRQPLILVTSGSDYASDRQNAIESGADACLVKPIVRNELLRMMEANSVYQSASTPKKPSLVEPDTNIIPSDLPPMLRFWGVRGSIPTPGPLTVQFGGNTSCVEVRADGEIIVLDAGSGIRGLGLALAKEFGDQPIKTTLLISHTHWDHIQGFPFFVPAYNPENKVRIVGYEGSRKGLVGSLSTQMESPYFPVSLRQMPSNINVTEMKELEFSIGRVKVQAAFANHPGVTVGYRLFTSAGSIVYLPDHEPYQRLRCHDSDKRGLSPVEMLKYASDQDQRIIEWIMDAEVLIIDAQYDDAEYQTHAGWGHGCVDDVVALALSARVKQLFLFHHDPDHDDSQIFRMEAWARQLVSFANENLAVSAACEGVRFELKTLAAEVPAATPLWSRA
jgi:phosphoribosyl 1,2-cyclic phosphodiesterase/CheY-like chemotaxis protein